MRKIEWGKRKCHGVWHAVYWNLCKVKLGRREEGAGKAGRRFEKGVIDKYVKSHSITCNDHKSVAHKSHHIRIKMEQDLR